MTPDPRQSSSLMSLLSQQQGDSYGQSDDQMTEGITGQLKGIMTAAVNVASANPNNPQMAELMRQIRQLAMHGMTMAQQGSESASGMTSAPY